MDLGASIVGIIVILICSIPFIIMTINSRKRKEKIVQELSKIAEKQNCKITQHNLWNNSSIGIDEHNKVVFFTKNANNNETVQQVNLSEIQKCRVLYGSKNINNDNSNFAFTDKLDLAFSYRDSSKRDVIIPFYNADFDSLSLSGELQLVEKWCKISNDIIAA